VLKPIGNIVEKVVLKLGIFPSYRGRIWGGTRKVDFYLKIACCCTLNFIKDHVAFPIYFLIEIALTLHRGV